MLMSMFTINIVFLFKAYTRHLYTKLLYTMFEVFLLYLLNMHLQVYALKIQM